RHGWDGLSAASLRRSSKSAPKPSVSFEEAKTVFTDEFDRLIADPDHSVEEDRFLLLGTNIDSHLKLSVTASEKRTAYASFLRVKRVKKNAKFMRASAMRDHYDFSDSVKNPYAKKLKKQVTIRLDEDTIVYFKDLAEDKGIPYQRLINLYLRDCAQSHRDLKMEWK
ncbi:MAG: CopG family antitoxin, partial [Pontibacterium sp.]